MIHNNYVCSSGYGCIMDKESTVDCNKAGIEPETHLFYLQSPKGPFEAVSWNLKS